MSFTVLLHNLVHRIQKSTRRLHSAHNTVITLLKRIQNQIKADIALYGVARSKYKQ